MCYLAVSKSGLTAKGLARSKPAFEAVSLITEKIENYHAALDQDVRPGREQAPLLIPAAP